jgi:hypothetical protein
MLTERKQPKSLTFVKRRFDATLLSKSDLSDVETGLRDVIRRGLLSARLSVPVCSGDASTTPENIRLIVAVVVSVEQASQHVAVHAPEGFDIGLRIHLETRHHPYHQGDQRVALDGFG